MSTVTDTVNSRSIIFASAHRFDADIRLGSSHLAREMAKRGWRVLFIEQPTSPFHLLNPSSARVAASKLAGALAGGIAGHASGTSGVEVLNTVSLLPHVNAPLLRSAFTLEHWRASTLPPLSRAISSRGFDRAAALVFDSPFYHPLVSALAIPGVYRYADRMSKFAGVTQAMLDMQERVIREAALVIYTADALAADLAQRSGPVLNLPNGVDLEPYLVTQDEPAPLAPLPRPRVVYSGAFEAWFDAELVAEAAQRMPGVQFVLIGDAAALRHRFSNLPNIHMTGRIPHEQVAPFLQHCDVGIIPFRRDGDNGLVEAINPLKLYEYCAAGLPVVAYRSPEFDRLEAPVIGYDTLDGFVAGMERALADAAHDAVRTNQRIWAAEHSWSGRAAALDEAIKSILDA